MASTSDIQRHAIWQAELDVSLLLKSCAKHEDTYRACGLLYHKTSTITRDATAYLETQHARLKKAFEITTPAAYTALFAPLTDLHQRMTALQSDMRHFLLPGPRTEEQFTAIFPRYEVLCVEYIAASKFFDKVKKGARWLSARNEGFVDLKLAPSSFQAWKTLHTAERDGEYAPDTMAMEFYMLRQWVLCLPETQRVVSAGLRDVDDVISHMLLLDDGDGFEDEDEEHDSDVDMDEDEDEGSTPRATQLH